MDIELRLREILTVQDPGVQLTDAVMSRVGDQPSSEQSGAGISRLSDARARRRRRFVVVGTLLAMAAAAGMLLVHRGGNAPPKTPPATATIPAATGPDPVTATVARAPAVPEVTSHPPAQEKVTAAPSRDLPLLPPLVYNDPAPTEDLVLQKAVERHPELVEGPEVDGKYDMFFVVMVMRANGSVISSAARLARPEEFRAVSAELQRMLPKDAGYGYPPANGQRARHTRLPDGRSLRANVVLNFLIVPDGYDATRSSVKVDQLMRARHPELFLPSSDVDMNRVTILLTGDGNIDREKVERVRASDRQSVRAADIQGISGPEGVSRLAERLSSLTAERIASTLGINVDQIGAMGNLTVEEGSFVVLEDANGIARPDDQRRRFLVVYAWPRREGESAPSMGQAQLPKPFTAQDFQQESDRKAVELTIVERLVPDAFTRRNSDAGTPVVALNTRGEVIGVMRVNTRGEERVPSRATIRELQQLDPGFGVRNSRFSSETLRNKNGATAEVTFAWVDLPPEPAQAK